jgi:nanoRNase/pAp phosphatase (c-di-AMP/oligoRNAs hydrolase)
MSKSRLERMIQAVEGSRRILVLTHDNPDPDAIASAWALGRVLKRMTKRKVSLAYSGIVGRTENRTMIEVLKVPIKPVNSKSLAAADAIAMVDCQPGAGNVSLPVERDVHIVLDHHPMRPRTRKASFHDVRSEVGATATLSSEYLEAADIRPDRRLATALFYAIRTETQNLGRETSATDVRHFTKLFPLVDNVALSRIELAPISRGYFAIVDRAIDGTRIYQDRLAVTTLGRIQTPDVVAQFADLMVRMEGVRWSLVMGRHNQTLLLSIRTNRAGANAGRVISRIVGQDGSAGGHGMMAAGRIHLASATRDAFDKLENSLRRRALKVLKIKGRGTPLVRMKG